MVAVRHVGYLKFKFLTFVRVRTNATHHVHVQTFHRNIFYSCGDRLCLFLSVWLKNEYSGPLWEVFGDFNP